MRCLTMSRHRQGELGRNLVNIVTGSSSTYFWTNICPRGGPPPKGVIKANKDFFSNFSIIFRAQKLRLLAFPGVLEGLGSSGGLVGTISTYPGAYKCPWSRVMANNPPEETVFTEYGSITSRGCKLAVGVTKTCSSWIGNLKGIRKDKID